MQRRALFFVPSAVSLGAVLYFASTGHADEKKNLDQQLSGKWKNQLGSIMVIEAKNGDVKGFYQTSVGNAVSAHPIQGVYCEHRNEKGDPEALIAWNVVWNKTSTGKPSLTSWNGHLVYDPTSRSYKITTTWLLSRPAPFNELWSATIINKDTFSKE